MGEHTSISWCDRTFNPWIGCTKVSVGDKGACANCYAEVATPTRAMHIMWGPGEPRHRTSPATWALPLRWERGAEAFQAEHGRRQRVFCASLADVFDNEVNPTWRADLFRLIRATPSLDWLLLTKRIGNAEAMIDRALADGHLLTSREPFWPWPNVWLGSTVVTQEEAERDVPKLLATPARVRFLSCEPLLGLIDLRRIARDGAIRLDALTGFHSAPSWSAPLPPALPGIDWVIAGGESGPKARPMHPSWARALRDQCTAALVPFLFKQWGQYLPEDQPEARQFSAETEDGREAFETFADGSIALRVGKHFSGRTLDGRVWDEFPEVKHAR